jgi:ABC-2 type transport system ATP-binding protein
MILEVKNLNKSFRHPWKLQKIQVLKDVNFHVDKKAIVGFLGSNGAGKTTSIKCLLGLLTFDSGDLKVFGKDHLDKEVKKNIGYLPERPFFYNYLTAEEFLTFYGQLSGLDKSQLDKRIDELLEVVGLSHAKKMYLKQFSKGMLQRVGMAQALIHRPKLLILDEPLSGLDPDGRRQLVKIIQNAYDNEESSIFFSSHLLDDIDRLCQELVVIKKGVVEFCGKKSEFVDRGDRKFQISYNSQGQRQKLKVDNITQLQKEIDTIRKQGFEIIGVEQEKVSLDRAFKEFHGQEIEEVES